MMIQNERAASEYFLDEKNQDMSTQVHEEEKWVSASDIRLHHEKAGSGRRNPSDHSNKRPTRSGVSKPCKNSKNIHIAKWSTKPYDPE
jgi:hypothetical protein